MMSQPRHHPLPCQAAQAGGTRISPFGAYKILSDKEIDLVADFLYTL